MGNAMRYMLTGDHWGAQEAYRMGVIAGDRAPTARARRWQRGSGWPRRSLRAGRSAIAALVAVAAGTLILRRRGPATGQGAR